MEMGNPLFLLSLSFIHMEIKKSAVGNVQITLKTEEETQRQIRRCG